MVTETGKELTVSRVFDAPRDVVWKAWTDPNVLRKWWGPNGVTNPTCEWDARPGGRINIVMLAGKELGSLEGQEWPMSGTFEAVEPKEKIVYVSSALEDRKGNHTLVEARTTVTFSGKGEKTELTIHIEVISVSDSPKASFALRGMEAGWNQQIDKLGGELEGSK